MIFIDINFNAEKNTFLSHYRFLGFNVFPGAVVIETFLACLYELKLLESYGLEKLKIIEPIFLTSLSFLNYRVIFDTKNKTLSLYKLINNDIEETFHATASLCINLADNINIDIQQESKDGEIHFNEFKIAAEKSGLHYGSSYSLLDNFSINSNGVLVNLTNQNNNYDLVCLPYLTYTGFQVMSVLIARAAYKHRSIFLPSGIKRIFCHTTKLNSAIDKIYIKENQDSESNYTYDVYLLSRENQPILSIISFSTIKIDPKNLIDSIYQQLSSSDLQDDNISFITNQITQYLNTPIENFSVSDHYAFLLLIVFAKQFGLVQNLIEVCQTIKT